MEFCASCGTFTCQNYGLPLALECDQYRRKCETMPEEKMVSSVKHPAHYGSGEYECLKVLKNWMQPAAYNGFLYGNIIKYMCRYEKKGNPLQDLKKAKEYLEALIAEYDT